MLLKFNIFNKSLSTLKNQKTLINTINAYSYNVSQKDSLFKESLMKCDVLIPDGVSIVWALNFLKGNKINKIAGADLFFYEMQRLQEMKGTCFFFR